MSNDFAKVEVRDIIFKAPKNERKKVFNAVFWTNDLALTWKTFLNLDSTSPWGPDTARKLFGYIDHLGYVQSRKSWEDKTSFLSLISPVYRIEGSEMSDTYES